MNQNTLGKAICPTSVSGGCPQQIQPATQLETQIAVLSKEVSENQLTLNSLEQRLSRVLRPFCPDPGKETGEQEMLVDHAESIRSIAESVRTQGDHLRSILDRLEA